MTRAVLALTCLLAATSASASLYPDVSVSTSVLETDSRIELLGVVQILAGMRGSRAPLPKEYGKAIESRFGRFRGHEAVKLYRALAGKYQDFGVDALFLTPPPELKPADAARLPPFGGGSADLESFLAALRRFASESDFAGFYKEQKPTYDSFVASARAEMGARDFPHIVENYVGSGLDCRAHFLLSPSYSPSQGVSYIIPYPDPEHGAYLQGPYDVYVVLTPEGSAKKPSFVGSYRGLLLDELIYVYVERTWFPFTKDPAKDGLKDSLVRAIGLRLRSAACPAGASCGGRRGRKVDASTGLFASRLEEYERARDRYPALSDFYPVLLPESARSTSASETEPTPKADSRGQGSPDARSQ